MTRMDLSDAIAATGHLASRRQLASMHIGRHIVDRALDAHVLLPVRPGWVATSSANQLAVIAVLRGAQLTSATALRSYGIWAGDDPRLHLQLPPNAHRVIQAPLTPLTPLSHFTRPALVRRGEKLHWTSTSQDNAPNSALWRVSVADAIIQFAAKETDEQIAAACESAVHEHRLSRTGTASLLRRLPRRLRRLANQLNFLGESGMETIVRMRLEHCGLRFAQQVQIGDARVDLLLENWLVIELDGDEWHDPVRDRSRTNRLVRAGFRVLRFGYKDIFEHWEESLATILEMLQLPSPA